MDAHGRPTLDAARLVEVLDGVSVLFYVQDPDGRITYANRAACELVGRPPEEVIGRMPEELFDPVTVERWAAQNREVLATGRPLDMEDGWGERTHLTQKTPVFDAEGQPVAVIGLSTDISAHKRAEEALRRSEAQLAEAQQIAGVGSWHWDPDAHEITWSAELQRMLGLDARSASRWATTRSSSSTRTTASGSPRVAGGDGLRRHDGARVPHAATPTATTGCCSAAAAPRWGPTAPSGASTASARTSPSAATPSSGSPRRSGSAQIGSFDRDLERDEVTWSPETYRIFGVEPDTTSRRARACSAWSSSRTASGCGARSTARSREDGGFDCFVTIRRGDGELRDLRIRGAVHRAGGGPRHLIGICQDLTDIRAAERARIELDERFRSIFERAPVGIALVARGGRFTLVNEALAEFLGRDRDALEGMQVDDVTHPEDMPASAEAMRQMAAGELDEWNTEKRYVRPDGEVRWGALRALLLHDADGRSTHCLALRARRHRAAAGGAPPRRAPTAC